VRKQPFAAGALSGARSGKVMWEGSVDSDRFKELKSKGPRGE